ncbi:MFS transporter [Ramlibacter sp.]|uniref:MFS transporter n=1 Tax=Ramlibacter sp. TaxID=1917967 RepID=UPI003D1530C4
MPPASSTPLAPSAPSPIPVRLVAALTFGHVAFIGYRFTFLLHAVKLGAAPLEIGVLLGLLMLGPMLLSVQFGRWSDRFGYGRLCALGFSMEFVAGVLAIAGASMPALYVTSVLTGCGYMLAYVAALNATGKLTRSEDMTRAFAMLTMSLSLSALVAPLVCGYAIDHWGHAAGYAAMAGSTVISLSLLAWAVRKYRVAPMPAVAKSSGSLLELIWHPNLRTIFMVSALLSMGWDTFGFLAPLHGVHAGLSATAIGVIVGIFAGGSFAVRLALPLLSRRLGEWRILCIALLVTGAGFVAFPVLTNFWALVAVAFVLGMSLGCAQPTSMSLIYRASPPERAGEAGGVRAAIVSSSQTALPMIFGALGSAVGLAAVFWCTAALLIAGGARALRHRV